MIDIARREYVYLAYYLRVLIWQIAPYWIAGIVIGSCVSVFARDKIHSLFILLEKKRIGVFGVIPASLLGIASPLCMFGTIPIVGAFSERGMREDWIAGAALDVFEEEPLSQDSPLRSLENVYLPPHNANSQYIRC